MSKYPEHDKLQEVANHSQAIGEFIDWLQSSKGIVLAEWYNETQLAPIPYRTTESLLAEYFDIDQRRLEREKRAMLDELRDKATD